MQRVVDRINRQKARDFLISKLQRICWNHWRIYRIESEKDRLNLKLASEFRDQVLMRALFNNLQVSTRVMKDLYSSEKVGAIMTKNRMRACFTYLKMNREMKLAIIN